MRVKTIVNTYNRGKLLHES